MRYIVACNLSSVSMATTDPKAATVAAKASAAPPVEPNEIQEEALQVECVNINGLVLEKTVDPNGECKTAVLKEPMISLELVRATQNLQRSRGR
jgi:hypothetical protein